MPLTCSMGAPGNLASAPLDNVLFADFQTCLWKAHCLVHVLLQN